MVRKPDIQYIGQFYVYGSEAKALAEKERKKALTSLPLERLRSIQKVYVDPVALFGIAVAVFMFVTMIIGAVNIRGAWDEYDKMQHYVTQLQQENSRLELEYSRGYNLADIESTAVSLGMIPVAEAQTMTVRITPPVVEEEPTAWEEFRDYVEWFIDGLFA